MGSRSVANVTGRGVTAVTRMPPTIDRVARREDRVERRRGIDRAGHRAGQGRRAGRVLEPVVPERGRRRPAGADRRRRAGDDADRARHGRAPDLPVPPTADGQPGGERRLRRGPRRVHPRGRAVPRPRDRGHVRDRLRPPGPPHRGVRHHPHGRPAGRAGRRRRRAPPRPRAAVGRARLPGAGPGGGARAPPPAGRRRDGRRHHHVDGQRPRSGRARRPAPPRRRGWAVAPGRRGPAGRRARRRRRGPGGGGGAVRHVRQPAELPAHPRHRWCRRAGRRRHRRRRGVGRPPGARPVRRRCHRPVGGAVPRGGPAGVARSHPCPPRLPGSCLSSGASEVPWSALLQGGPLMVDTMVTRPATGTVDAVTAEVIRSAMETVCFEMATFVSRTATTPILNQSNERNATIHDWQGRLAALSVGIPQFMLTATLPIAFALEYLADDLYPGDVLIANDPYHGGGHLPDFNVFAPVFHTHPDGHEELVLIASIQCHHGDTGGAMAGGYNVFAKDIWSEGTRYPLLKIIERGKERRDVVLTMRSNNRIGGFMGDLRSQVGAAQLGVRRLSEIIDRYGPEAVKATVDFVIADTRRRFREEIAAWPDGTYEADTYGDADH